MEAKQNEINSLKDQLQKGQNALSDQAKQELIHNIDAKTKTFNRDMEEICARSWIRTSRKCCRILAGR